MSRKVSKRVSQAIHEEQQEETQAAPPKASLEPPPIVEPLYRLVRCQYCQTLLPLDPPRKAGESVTCGVCGAVVTVFHPPPPEFTPEQIQGRLAQAQAMSSLGNTLVFLGGIGLLIICVLLFCGSAG